jgi:hypothetical protein
MNANLTKTKEVNQQSAMVFNEYQPHDAAITSVLATSAFWFFVVVT